MPRLAAGDAYKFEICRPTASVLRKADPFALVVELRPDTACVVQPLPAGGAAAGRAPRANARDAPISIYEVHLGSWRRKPNGHEWLTYRELADAAGALRHATWASPTSS